MKNHIKANKEYLELVEKYTTKDGIMAILLYLLVLATTFFQGYLFTTNLSAEILTASQVFISFFDLILCFTFLWISKDKMNSIGLTIKNIKKSLLFGVVGALLLLGIIVIFNFMDGTIQGNIFFQMLPFSIIVHFVICAISEEIIFRGYIQTRIIGLIRIDIVAICVNAIFFLSIHYPVRWVTGGTVDLVALPVFYIACLILLHILCDLTYRRTNCLWGAMLLHILYNTISAMIIFG